MSPALLLVERKPKKYSEKDGSLRALGFMKKALKIQISGVLDSKRLSFVIQWPAYIPAQLPYRLCLALALFRNSTESCSFLVNTS